MTTTCEIISIPPHTHTRRRPPFLSRPAGTTRRGGSVGSNAGHQRTSSAFNGGDDISPGGLDGCGEDGNVDLNGLSFVERQEEWLRRKQNSIRSKANDLERAAKDAATFNPNLVISQSSLRPAQVRYRSEVPTDSFRSGVSFVCALSTKSATRW